MWTHFFSFAPFIILSISHSMFSSSLPLVLSLSLFPPLSHSHFHTLIHTYSFAFFLIGHCLYSSLFSLLKIAFIRNIDSHKTKRECLTFDKCSVHWWQFVLFFLTISSFSFMCYLFFLLYTVK